VVADTGVRETDTMALSGTAALAIANEVERLERENGLLRMQNRRLAEEKLNSELKLSLRVLDLTKTIADFQTRLERLESAHNVSANLLQGLVLAPTRDEWERLVERVEGLCAREVV
jgi:hypothetical protein